MELACILERHGSHAKQRYPGVRVARTLDEMLSDESIRLCVVATPNDSHFSYAKACTSKLDAMSSSTSLSRQLSLRPNNSSTSPPSAAA